MLQKKLITTLIYLSSLPVLAATCDKVIISTEDDWAPYSYIEDGEAKGVAPEIAKSLFDNIDIPIIIVPEPLPAKKLIRELSHNFIDMMILSHKRDELSDLLEYIEPPFAGDAMVVATSPYLYEPVFSWRDLIGRVGVATPNYPKPAKMADKFSRYLFLRDEPTVLAALKDVHSGEVEYYIDSRDRINSAVIKNDIGKEIVILPQSANFEGIYLALNKESNCINYVQYISDKLKIMLEDGTIAKLIKKHYPNLIPEPAIVEQKPVVVPE